MNVYKLQVKLGQAEFVGEGDEQSVRADYSRFLEALERSSSAVSPPRELVGTLAGKGEGPAEDLDEGTMNAIYKVDADRGVVSLKVQPPAAGENRVADAALMLIFGHHRMLGATDAPVTKLTAGLRESGVKIDRFDRAIGVHSELVMKGGQRIGARYRLNNPGMAYAAEMVRRYFN